MEARTRLGRSANAWWGVALCGTLLSGCPEDASTGTTNGLPTGASCDTAISYENDIAPLMRRYCTSCHSAQLAPEARHGAPSDHDFDSEVALLANPQHVIDYAGAGTLGINDAMPPAGWPEPTLGDRHMLASYLTCYADGGAPPHTHADGGH